MTALEQDRVLRLHTAPDGVVWYCTDFGPAVNSELDTKDFVQYRLDGLVKHVRGIHMLGVADNASLILRHLQSQHQQSARPIVPATVPVMLGSPCICRAEAQRRDPGKVLYYLRQSECRLPGQWHKLTTNDYATYALVAAMARDTPDAFDRRCKILPYHPAWAVVSFISFANASAICQLLATIVDPRWFLHETRPHRQSRLLAFLGITPQNVLAYLGRGPRGRHYERAATAISAWYHEEFTTTRLNGPADFLWRIFASQTTLERGVLRSTERMLSLLYHVWLYNVASPHPEVAFNPAMFFKTPAEIEAFVAHSDRMRKF